MYDLDCKIIKGKWHKNKYKVIKPLGKGGIGNIYLAFNERRGFVALKISKSMLSITREYDNINKYKNKNFVPIVYELDDWEYKGETYYFFVMEYIKGYDLAKVISNSMSLKLKLKIFMIILGILEDINREGLIYSDMKWQNVMVDYDNQSIRFIDFGSLVPVGEVVKEYTPLYDRCSWGMGTRVADLGYQVFGAAVLLITMLTRTINKVDKKQIPEVFKILKKTGISGDILELLNKALYGEIKDCGTFLRELKKVHLNLENKKSSLNILLDIIIGVLVIALIIVAAKIKSSIIISLL